MLLGENTLTDLEFLEVIEQVSAFGIHPKAKEEIKKIRPSSNTEQIEYELQWTWEYLGSMQSENQLSFSNYHWDENYLKRIEIENYHLQPDVFLGIRLNLENLKGLQKSISIVEETYPSLHKLIHSVIASSEVLKEINTTFKRTGEIKSNATQRLKKIRDSLAQIGKDIDAHFQAALKRNTEYLDPIKESVLDGQRVLAVSAHFKRRVPGKTLGSSKTGSILFIAPNAIIPLYKRLEEVQQEEKEELRQILLDLTTFLIPFKETLNETQQLLLQIDVVRAKAYYGREINGIKPEISLQNEWHLDTAYHPLLWRQNQTSGKQTIPQSLKLNPKQRIIVISGPNAGGKSLTLKTIGLLQLMFQAGILVPVKEGSSFSFYEKLYTDIGDHQSIENRLSTYSYRLKQMAYFLRKMDDKTLLLIDEFGTGSDPLLGGAIAEVFLEEFYEKETFAVITSHYTNIKIRTEKLDFATNANMLFDQKTLAPTYQLIIGQAGSSFTFEVAEKNRIPYRLLNRAKKKIEKEKIKFDKTISNLQSEKIVLEKQVKKMNVSLEEQTQTNEIIKQKEAKIQKKLVDFQMLYDQNQKELFAGKKMIRLAREYAKNPQKKRSIGEFLKWLEMEASTITHKIPETKTLQKFEKKLQKEIEQQSEQIEEVIETKKQKVFEDEKKFRESLKEGERVRMKGSKSVGTIDRVGKKSVKINYGKFTSEVPFDELEKL